MLHPLYRCRTAIGQPAEQQRVGKAGDAQADPALGLGLGLLLRQRVAGDVDHIVEQSDGKRGYLFQPRRIDVHAGLERALHQCRQVDRTKQAGAIGRQHLFAAGVGRTDRLAIGQVVRLVDPVDEDHPRFGIVIGGAHQPVPQLLRGQGAIDFAAELQRPVRPCIQRGHEGIRDQNRKVEIAQPRRIALCLDEVQNVGVVDAQAAHHRPAPRACRLDRAAHRVPAVHEGQGAGCIRAHAFYRGTLGPDGGEIHADPAALLHGQRGLFQVLEDAAQIVRDRAHHEAVEQGDRAAGARPGQNTPGGNEGQGLNRFGKALFPHLALGGLFVSGHGLGHACCRGGKVRIA